MSNNDWPRNYYPNYSSTNPPSQDNRASRSVRQDSVINSPHQYPQQRQQQQFPWLNSGYAQGDTEPHETRETPRTNTSYHGYLPSSPTYEGRGGTQNSYITHPPATQPSQQTIATPVPYDRNHDYRPQTQNNHIPNFQRNTAQTSAPQHGWQNPPTAPIPPNHSPGRGEGMEIRDYFSPNTTSTLDPEFKIQQVGFFTVGRMFATLFTEAYGSTATSYNDSVSFVKFGEQVYTQIRRFIVVRAPRRNGHCYACPVFTYEGRATTKRGVDPYEHAIAYSVGNTALRLPGERVDKTIGVIMKDGEPALTDTSRLRFGIYHPIQLNVKVKDLGMVQPEDMQNLVAWWREEQGPIS